MTGRIRVGLKVVALLLILGGIAGILGGLWGDVQILKWGGFRPSPALITSALFILLFGFCAHVGLSLWRGRPEALKWAKVIFAAQIPVFTVPGFQFSGFYTGLALTLMLSRETPSLRFFFGFLSSLRFAISDSIDNVLVGVNLVAIFVSIYLFHATVPDRARSGDRFGLI